MLHDPSIHPSLLLPPVVFFFWRALHQVIYKHFRSNGADLSLSLLHRQTAQPTPMSDDCFARRPPLCSAGSVGYYRYVHVANTRSGSTGMCLCPTVAAAAVPASSRRTGKPRDWLP